VTAPEPVSLTQHRAWSRLWDWLLSPLTPAERERRDARLRAIAAEEEPRPIDLQAERQRRERKETAA
jgi:hypothetical protein